MAKEKMTAQKVKAEFVKSMHRFMMKTLDDLGRSEYKDNFQIEGSSIMCELPTNYFKSFDIPEGIKIEMKFIVKKD